MYHWIAVFRLKNGRYKTIKGLCKYTTPEEAEEEFDCLLDNEAFWRDRKIPHNAVFVSVHIVTHMS